MTGIIVLAAGSSSRLGQPKQLVTWKGMPLIRHAAITAISANLGSVAIVLGANAEPCREALLALDVSVVENTGWAQGMGGSIAAGVTALSMHQPENIIITLCDLPLITAATFSELVHLRETHQTEVVASHNGSSFSPPMLFSKSRFGMLQALSGAEGARALLVGEKSLTRYDCPQAAMDIDTPEDLVESRKW